MTYFRLLWIHLRLGVMNELQYRTNLFIQLVQSTVGLMTALLGLGIVFSKTDSLAGWSAPELLAIVGVFTLVSGITQFVVRPSLARFMEDVRLGTLDFTLTKPVDAQVLVSMRQVEVWKLVDVVVGFVVLGVAVAQLGATVGVDDAIAFLVALLAGVTIIYSFLLILATCAFWFVRLDNILNIFQSMYEAGRWPIGIYPPWLRTTPDISGADRLRHHGPRRGTGRPPDLAESARRPRAGGHPPPACPSVLEDWRPPLLRRLGVTIQSRKWSRKSVRRLISRLYSCRSAALTDELTVNTPTRVPKGTGTPRSKTARATAMFHRLFAEY